MSSKPAYITKSRLIVAISMGLVFLGVYAVVYLQSRHTDQIVNHAIADAEHEIEFLSGLIKKVYLKRDFVEVENILRDWDKQHSLDTSIKAIAANGYEFFSSPARNKSSHSKLIHRNIMRDGHPLLTLYVERDLGEVYSNAKREKKEYLLLGLTFAGVFGVLIWVLLEKFAFSPLEQEIKRRHLAEENLKHINDDLEIRVEKRTSAIKKLSGVVQQTDDIVVITDPDGVAEYVNPAFEKITGYSSGDVVGKKLELIKSGMHEEIFYTKLWETIVAGDSFRDVFINRKKNGDIYYEEKTITPLKDENGEIHNYVSTGKDISDRMEIQEKLHHMATHDALTELPNRVMVNDRLLHAIEQGERSQSKIAVIFIDLDRFKEVNDSLGHPSGDALLKVIGSKLKSSLRHGDTLGRFGGDEFTILMEGINHIDDVNAVMQKILKTVSEPVLIGGYEIVSSASIGITIFPDDADNVDALVKNADVAMYRAKSRGGNTFEFYTHDMSVKADERMKLQHRLNHAVERGEFKLHYQPRVNVQTGQVTGMEALLRWDHPEMGLVSPSKFIPILEETGKIVEVGHWVFSKACRFVAELKQKGLQSLRVSVNLSARQFHDQDLLQCIEEICALHHFESRYLEVEITESLLIENMETAAAILDRLHEVGVHISIDDFGTGYSSMSYLKRFPIDSLKVDQSFVKDIPNDKDDVAIVRAIVALGESLGINLVAEGVETAAQLEFFTEVDQCEIQGFYIGKPMPQEEFITWLVEHNKKLEKSVVTHS
jgi:diguanylate cyclase (GGDEF)-like protein/PAS domain S-box-containing protein